MSKKNKKASILIIFVILIPICFCFIIPEKTIKLNNKYSNLIDDNTLLKQSGYKITEEWIYETLGRIEELSISDDGYYIVGITGDRVKYFNRTSNETLWDYKTPGGISDHDISHDGEYIVVAESFQCYLFNKSGYVLHKIPSSPIVADYRVSISENGDYFAVTNGTHILLYDQS
ncbi:MAG: hypothetical protein ACFFDH_19590, partial [Promethearchaeota archaeon]